MILRLEHKLGILEIRFIFAVLKQKFIKIVIEKNALNYEI